ncbi:MAG: DUF1732 domain-containing protein, partial [Magnetococcales bacterium]|nr:DUF1732 domain-containing protein [Magnetococcales bacterium]
IDRLPQVQKAVEERLRTRLKMLVEESTLDDNRLAQEQVYLLNRLDLSEELDRLRVHLGEVSGVLDQHQPVGRRLDFLCQELNREANTLCSKSQDARVSRLGVEIKVLVEKLREQVQNIE